MRSCPNILETHSPRFPTFPWIFNRSIHSQRRFDERAEIFQSHKVCADVPLFRGAGLNSEFSCANDLAGQERRIYIRLDSSSIGGGGTLGDGISGATLRAGSARPSDPAGRADALRAVAAR